MMTSGSSECNGEMERTEDEFVATIKDSCSYYPSNCFLLCHEEVMPS